jgi:cohesin complex subunit SA-1/2
MDEEKVANLLQIPQYFDLEIYVTSRQEKNLDLLMRHIANIVEKHSDSEVLENCSKVLEYFVGDNNSIKSRCLTARDTLVDKLVDRYRQAMTSFFEEGEEPDEDDTFALLTSLKRLYAFWQCHDLNPWMLWESHSHFLSCTTVAVPEEILCKAISCCHLSIIWQLDALDSKNPSKEGMKALQSCLSRFMNACTDMLDKYNDVRQEEAYLCISDMLIIFGHSVAQNSPQLEPLIFDAGKDLQKKLTRFLNDKVFIEDDDDGMDENKKIEELHKRRNFLASFCKLIVYNVIKIKCATDMFKYYMKFYNDYGDIIKATLSKAREINKVHTAKTLALSLTQLYRELREEQPVVDRSSESFRSIKELARRFSLSFGLDQVKNREAVAAMHKEGIQFVVNTTSFAFLEILAEFSGKLMKQDKKVVLAYLDSCLRMPPDPFNEDYSLLTTYRHTLLMGEGDTTTAAAPATGAKRGRGAKRKLNIEAEETTVQFGGQLRAGGRTPAHSSSISAAQPPLTLSVTKRPHLEPESASEADIEAPSEQDYESTRPSFSGWRMV